MTDHLKRAFKLNEQGRWARAEVACRDAVAADSGNAIAWQLLGTLCLRNARITQSVYAFSKAHALTPNDPNLAVNFASALRIAARYDEAITLLEFALSQKPNTPEAHLTLAQCLTGLNQHANADESYQSALTLRPAWPQALEERAFCLRRLGRNDDALDLAKQALRLDGNRASCLRLVADYLQESGQLADAVEHYERSIQFDSNDGHTHNNLGLTLMKLGECERAAQSHRRAVELIGNDPVIQYDLSLALLALGRLADGWPLYSARHALPGNLLGQRKHRVARLSGHAVKDLSLFAWTDQGVGEEIMFAQLVPDLISRGAKLTLECEPRLVSLFARSFPEVKVVSRELGPNLDNELGCAAQLALADTAAWLRPSLASFPNHMGYLVVDRALLASLKARYRKTTTKLTVGLAWRTAAAAKLAEHKSVALDQWGPILSQPNGSFVSLQYGDVAQEIDQANEKFRVSIFHDREVDPMADLDSFAAQVAAMDLVITTSNATAHMAGALGIPCWVVLPSGAGRLWHWFVERNDSPWYPSVKLYRHSWGNDWTAVLSQIGTALAGIVKPAQTDEHNK